MKHRYICCLFLLSFSLFRCYGMGRDGVASDMFSMEGGRMPGGRTVDQYVDRLELTRAGLSREYISGIKRQLREMDPDRRNAFLAQTQQRNRGMFSTEQQQSQQNSVGWLDRLLGNTPDCPDRDYEDRRRIMEILFLVQDLHRVLLEEHTDLREQHGVVQGDLNRMVRKNKLCARIGGFVGAIAAIALTAGTIAVTTSVESYFSK